MCGLSQDYHKFKEAVYLLPMESFGESCLIKLIKVRLGLVHLSDNSNNNYYYGKFSVVWDICWHFCFAA